MIVFSAAFLWFAAADCGAVPGLLIELTFVDDAHRLALAARDALRLDEMDPRVNSKEALQGVDKRLFARRDLAEGVAERLLVHLNVDVEGVAVVDAVDDELVVR